jgi:hypothetical protein
LECKAITAPNSRPYSAIRIMYYIRWHLLKSDVPVPPVLTRSSPSARRQTQIDTSPEKLVQGHENGIACNRLHLFFGIGTFQWVAADSNKIFFSAAPLFRPPQWADPSFAKVTRISDFGKIDHRSVFHPFGVKSDLVDFAQMEEVETRPPIRRLSTDRRVGRDARNKARARPRRSSGMS